MRAGFPEGEHYIEPTAFGTWIRSPGVRETVESILIAVLMALLFRFFEAEAFVIPTGSMAPDLQGRHVDVTCPKCNFEYRGGASSPSPDTQEVQRVACPICRYPLLLQPRKQRDHKPFSGDRILVNKFAYDFAEPERWDVIVFKYPNNGKQNFIKRLIAKPLEGMLIEKGDIYTFDHKTESFGERKIARKPPRKLRSMLQLVDDTENIAAEIVSANWPSRWQQWSGSKGDQDWKVSEDYQQFSLNNNSGDTRWLRYRHLRPRFEDWDYLDLSTPELPKRMQGSTPAGELITDHYAYNETNPTAVGRDQSGRLVYQPIFPDDVGMQWVGDLAINASVEIKSDSGQLALEVVEAGIHYQCLIDIATGEGSFGYVSSSDVGTVTFENETTFQTSIDGTGNHEVLFANADNKLFLWIDDDFVAGCEFSRSGEVTPYYSGEDNGDRGDAEPAGIGGSGIEFEVSRLQVLRDIYYTSKNLTREMGETDSHKPSMEYKGISSTGFIREILQSPDRWQKADGLDLFQSRSRDESYVFYLDENQYFPMGDNSPESNDARIWEGERFIDGSYLLGEALFIYWPHAKTKPIPFWPNFERMTFIR